MSTVSSAARARFVGEVVWREGVAMVVDRLRARVAVPIAPTQGAVAGVSDGNTRESSAWSGELPEGSIVTVGRVGPSGAELEGPVLAKAGSARAEVYRIAWEHGLDPVYPPAVEHEVAGWLASDGIDDPSLVDLTHLPFVTIDGASSRDLDQAVHIEREGDGFCVRYALADASYYVRPGSALFGEALRRGASYYLPGLAIPMLPRALSEGLVSLNEGVDRRSLTVVMRLDAGGTPVSTELVRARVRSRAKLSFEAVQGLFDDEGRSALADREFEASLRLLREVGGLRLRDAVTRGVVRYHREEVDVGLDGDEGLEFVLLSSARREVELWNEQISLLCNREGARLLRDHPSPHVQPIFRVHPSPAPERLRALSRHLRALARVHGLDEGAWGWGPDGGGPSLAEFLARLPTEGPLAPVARAVQRQAIVVNVRSGYSSEPGPHHGVGAEAYARFSAPMREIVGVFVHKEALEMVAGASPHADADDEAMRARVVEAANRSRETQRRVTDLANRVVLDRIFARDEALAASERPGRAATVMGFSGRKVHVQLEAPTVDVKLYVDDLERWAGCALRLDDEAVTLREAGSGRVVLREGDRVALRVTGRDEARDRWVLVPVPPALAIGAR